MTVERKYRLTRLGPGEYLLPSNDAATLWRIYRYEETGSLVHVLDDGTERPVLGWFWAAAKYRRRLDPNRPVDEIDDPGEWDAWVDGFATRREAIAAVLRTP